MVSAFLSFVKTHKFFLPKDRILLAVSGGVDSVVMVDLFVEAGFAVGVAHCNFGLRGEESEKDAGFVKTLADSRGLKFYSKKFRARTYANKNKLSIQEAAREQRYAWFEEIRKANQFRYIATAHHADDAVETFFINLLRGTGIAGLTGIPLKSGNLIRPLAFAGKQELRDYAEAKGLSYREDSSNADDKYLRNRIRHHLVPLLEELSPAFRETLYREMSRFRETVCALEGFLNTEKENLLEKKGRSIRIKRTKLLEKEPLRFFLYELLKDFGFKEAVIADLAAYLLKGSYHGKVFFSPSHELYGGRDYLEIRKRVTRKAPGNLSILFKKAAYRSPLKFQTDILAGGKKFLIPADASVACLNASRLNFPLLLRRWKEGDWFRPLGMKGSKLLSDFFTDQKFTSLQKEETWIVESGGQIVWVVGYRIDDRFKLDPSAKEVFLIRLG